VAVAVALVALIVLLKVSEVSELALFAWKCLLQRACLVLYFAWLTGLALEQWRASMRSTR
jgi:hypothetical protein